MTHSSKTLIRHTFYLLITLVALLSSQIALASSKIHAAPQTLMARDIHRSAGGFVGEHHRFRLELPVPGILHLDLAVAGGAGSGARFVLLAADGARLQTLERSPSEHLAAVEAGTWWIEVTAEDPGRELPSYRLRTHLVTLTKGETDGELDLDPEATPLRFELDPRGRARHADGLYGETDGELDLDPEATPLRFELDPRGGARHADGLYGETDGELDLDPEAMPLRFEHDPAADALVRRLCDRDDRDDHGDTFLCASALEGHAAGEVGNGWGDDADVFRFTIARWQTLEITTEGDVDTYGTLFNEEGQRLSEDDDGGLVDNFRLVRTLGPGTYFVRVGGDGSTGVYSLSVQQL